MSESAGCGLPRKVRNRVRTCAALRRRLGHVLCSFEEGIEFPQYSIGVKFTGIEVNEQTAEVVRGQALSHSGRPPQHVFHGAAQFLVSQEDWIGEASPIGKRMTDFPGGQNGAMAEDAHWMSRMPAEAAAKGYGVVIGVSGEGARAAERQPDFAEHGNGASSTSAEPYLRAARLRVDHDGRHLFHAQEASSNRIEIFIIAGGREMERAEESENARGWEINDHRPLLCKLRRYSGKSHPGESRGPGPAPFFGFRRSPE